jgi:hypothetical protein
MSTRGSARLRAGAANATRHATSSSGAAAAAGGGKAPARPVRFQNTLPHPPPPPFDDLEPVAEASPMGLCQRTLLSCCLLAFFGLMLLVFRPSRIQPGAGLYCWLLTVVAQECNNHELHHFLMFFTHLTHFSMPLF